MRSDIALGLLTKLLEQLPNGRWWIVRQKKETELGLAKAFNLPCATIDALLINAGIFEERKAGLCRLWKNWDALESKLDEHSEHFETATKGKVVYVCRGKPIERSPAQQENSGVRITVRCTLDASLIAELSSSAVFYDESKAAAERQSKAKLKMRKQRSAQRKRRRKHRKSERNASLIFPKS